MESPTFYTLASLVLTSLAIFLAILRRLRRAVPAPLQRQPPLRRPLRVAILGAGVGACTLRPNSRPLTSRLPAILTSRLPAMRCVAGGASLSHWLRELYGDDLELTVVTDGPVGGRCQATGVGGREYEGGAAIISELNQYMAGFMRRLGLAEKCFPSRPTAVFDGRSLLVREANAESEAPLGVRRLAALLSMWRFGARYGLRQLMRLKAIMRREEAPRFDRLYAELEGGRAYRTPEEVLGALGPRCAGLTRETAAEWLTRSPAEGGGGVPRRIVDELVTGGMRSNYGGQGCDTLHAFVGLVSVVSDAPGPNTRSRARRPRPHPASS